MHAWHQQFPLYIDHNTLNVVDGLKNVLRFFLSIEKKLLNKGLVQGVPDNNSIILRHKFTYKYGQF